MSPAAVPCATPPFKTESSNFLNSVKLYIVDAYAFHLPEVPDFIMEEADASDSSDLMDGKHYSSFHSKFKNTTDTIDWSVRLSYYFLYLHFQWVVWYEKLWEEYITASLIRDF
ncbi:hypothetical protein H6P81_021177 [Aristolochia fimbriata]|uniref:Uncharacterized protein n=1 Tax=Aristolochia fimbriata TaxID=158543 RepID=A0AAV7DS85_ARIFI|nr:hypothetical protein H6P81_021177 [Aristolochia fimbriata]